ncbi:putative 11-beta-hydroxysteroid dehydrogenase [Helianthus anomalus]
MQDINFWGSVYPTHFAIPHLMKNQWKDRCQCFMCWCASKAALISFYESLRFEISPTITITILTLGYIYKQTSLRPNTLATVLDMKDVVPTMDSERCVKVVVDGIPKGATFITEPRFNKAVFLIHFLFPQLHQLYFNMLGCTGTGTGTGYGDGYGNGKRETAKLKKSRSGDGTDTGIKTYKK